MVTYVVQQPVQSAAAECLSIFALVSADANLMYRAFYLFTQN